MRETSRHGISSAAITLTATLLSVGCGNASERPLQVKDPHPSITAESICLHHYLIDVPGPIQVGAAPTEKFDGGYGLPGIHSNGTTVPKWRDMQITETHPTSMAGFDSLRSSAQEWYALARNRYTNTVVLDDEIKQARKVVSSIPADQGFTYRDAMENKLLNLLWIKKYLGDKTKSTSMAGQYALRNGVKYSVGYFDPADQRVRMFEGRPRHLGPDGRATAIDELTRIQDIYQQRTSTDIPINPGFCTGHGFINESSGPEEKATFASPFRSLSYPNLIFTITIKPAWNDGKRGAPPMSRYLPYAFNMIGLRASEIHGPVEAELAGAPAVIHGMKYNLKCGEEKCAPLEQAYEFTALTYGEPGRVDRPRIELKMVAALADDHNARHKTLSREEHEKKLYKPGLIGLTPPPYEVGRAIFESVVKSVRLRPGAIAPRMRERNAEGR